jgi:hypothetical protein
MINKFFIVSALFASAAHAHLQIGTYKGTDEAGAECSMKVEEVFYEADFHHPLNERVRVTIGEETIIVGHPPVIDDETATAAFDHDFFKGANPTQIGAHALVIHMDHSEEVNGPTSYSWIEHAYRANERVMRKCASLAFQAEPR